MAFFPYASKSIPFALMLALAAGCGSEDDPVENTDDTQTDEEDETDDGETTGRLDAGGGKLDAGKPPATGSDASTSKPDASTAKPDASTPVKTDASTPAAKPDASAPADAGTGGLPGLPDLGGLFPTNPPADAGSTPTNPGTGAGACNDKTPHGCFTPAADNQKGCPALSPEIPLGYPSIDQWDLCNGGAVGAGATCVWNGPNGATATCICDTGAHWLCAYL